MVSPMPSQITSILGKLVDPYLGQDLVKARIIQEIAISDSSIALRLVYPYPVARRIVEIKQSISKALARNWPTFQVTTDIRWKARRHVVQKGLKSKSTIKNIIAVASGKGGVGKSTVAVNLAAALKALGAQVAILDADIYGPSQPRMLGKQGIKAEVVDKKFVPIVNHGVPSISMGYLVNDDNAMIWRGPMVSSALQQLLNETAWPECDYLILDLPPGTGDIQLTMAQKIPISGAIVVTTPQDIALLDAKKAVAMFKKVEVPVLGIVENMSWHICEQCGHQEAIFGSNGGQKMATEYEIPLLAQLPLERQIQIQSDNGVPIVVAEPEGKKSQPFWEMAQHIAAKLALREVDYTITTQPMVLEEVE